MTFEIPKPGMPIYIDVDGRRLQLRFSLKTLKALEKDFNISVLKGDGLSVAFRDRSCLPIFFGTGSRRKTRKYRANGSRMNSMLQCSWI